jgi:radical SAM protein with 4Fe4S-binding SPASM domain
MVSTLFVKKIARAGASRVEAAVGRLYPMDRTLEAMRLRPYELHFELTNLCNANCIFCPYQFQEREHERMPEAVFEKALGDYVAEGGGSVFFTPIVGDALIHPRVLDFIARARSHDRIDRIKMITNAILADRYGAEAIVNSGLTTLQFSIAGFDEAMYERVYRSKQYRRVRRNILDLLEANRAAGSPVNMVIGLRPDRPLDEVMAHPDFQEVLAYKPYLDFTWSFTTAGGRITREMLPDAMKLRHSPPKKEACVNSVNGPIVLPDGTVLICSCVAAIDAIDELKIGNVTERALGDIWRGEQVRRFHESFGTDRLNAVCVKCDMYRNLDLYRRREGRERAQINRDRAAGRVVRREREVGLHGG